MIKKNTTCQLSSISCCIYGTGAFVLELWTDIINIGIDLIVLRWSSANNNNNNSNSKKSLYPEEKKYTGQIGFAVLHIQEMRSLALRPAGREVRGNRGAVLCTSPIGLPSITSQRKIGWVV